MDLDQPSLEPQKRGRFGEVGEGGVYEAVVHVVAGAAGRYEEVGDIDGEPILVLGLARPEGKAASRGLVVGGA